jgi:hypothetical protein
MSAQPASTVPSAHCTRTDDHLAGRYGCKTEVKDHHETFKAMLKAKEEFKKQNGGGGGGGGRSVTGGGGGRSVMGASVRSSFRGPANHAGPFAELFSNVAVEAAQQMRDARIMAELTRLQAENESLKKQLAMSERLVKGLERTQGMPAPGYPAQGYATQGYAAQGYAAQGYAAPGYAAPGYAAQIPGQPFTMQAAGGASMDQQAANVAQVIAMMTAMGGGGGGMGGGGGGMGGGCGGGMGGGMGGGGGGP